MSITSAELMERGLVILSQDIQTGIYYGVFGNEEFILKHLNLDLVNRPNRCVRVFEIPEVNYGRVAKIEEIRQCVALQ